MHWYDESSHTLIYMSAGTMRAEGCSCGCLIAVCALLAAPVLCQPCTLLTMLIAAWYVFGFLFNRFFLQTSFILIILTRPHNTHTFLCTSPAQTEVNVSGDVFVHEAGQYAWLHFPTVCAMEWHPFTISSPPHARTRSFHIKVSPCPTPPSQLHHMTHLTSVIVPACA